MGYGGYGLGGIWYLLERAGFTIRRFIRRDVGEFTGANLDDCDNIILHP